MKTAYPIRENTPPTENKVRRAESSSKGEEMKNGVHFPIQEERQRLEAEIERLKDEISKMKDNLTFIVQHKPDAMTINICLGMLDRLARMGL